MHILFDGSVKEPEVPGQAYEARPDGIMCQFLLHWSVS